MDSSCRSTGLYSARALKLLSVMNAASAAFTYRLISYARIEHSTDNEIVFYSVKNGQRQAVYTARQVAENIRDNVHDNHLTHIFEDYGKTSREKFEIATRSGLVYKFEIRELNCALDFLEGRPAAELAKTYGRKFVDGFVGRPLTPFEIGQKEAWKEETARLAEKYEKQIKDLKQKYFCDGSIAAGEYQRKSKAVHRKYNNAAKEAAKALGVPRKIRRGEFD